MSKLPNDHADNRSDGLDSSADGIHSIAAPRRQKPVVQKVTLYVRPEQIIQVEEIQLREHRRTRMRPDKSELVQEALDLLIEKYRQID
jgi:hypothetical protein